MSVKRAAVVILAAASLLVPAIGEAGQTTTRRVRIVDQGPNRFRPATLTIEPGTRVRWVNRGSLTHTTTSDTDRWDRTIPPGGAFTRVFRRRGTFEYHCSIHPSMRARIVVE
jgi:plastocyanin